MTTGTQVIPIIGVSNLRREILNAIEELRENCSHDTVLRRLREGTLIQSNLCLFCFKEGVGVGSSMTDVVGAHVTTVSREEYEAYKELLPHLIALTNWP